MYRLIVVDDEEEVRKGIIEKIEWNKYGFEIVGEADNGIEAMEAVEKVLPDVVLTDIRMPYMDGLALAEKLKARYPTIKIIFLTGINEFECAQMAVKLNVIDYILKPVSSVELTEMLHKIKQILDSEIARKKDYEMLREHYRRSLPLLRDKFLNLLITNRYNSSDVSRKAKSFGFEIDSNGFIVSVLRIDSDKVFKNNLREEQKVVSEEPESGVIDDRELLEFAVLNISEEITGKYKAGVVFTHNEYIVFIFTLKDSNKEDFINKSFSILEEIRISIEKYLETPVTIGIGRFCLDISFLPYSYEDAVTALDYSMVLKKNHVIYIEDLEPDNCKKLNFDELKERSLTSCIKVGTPGEISAVIDGLFKEIIQAQISFKDYQIYLLEMLTVVLKVAKDLNVDMFNLFGETNNLISEIYKLKELDDAREWLTNICIKIRNCISINRQDTSKQIVKKAVEYVNSNFHDSEIVIEKVCKHLHISSSYFSTLFKKEMNMTFNNYLTKVRMEAAKELLRTTNMKTYEIAQRVGFSEPNYFSYCFKKKFGISPSEFRNKLNNT
ncbi:MAG TPA: response regulator [Clostridiales bacterium]|nr:response regulator [Clostridiales bacterium]